MSLKSGYLYATLLIGVILFISSCKKEVENERPQIFIISPSSSQAFQILDTIIVSATVSDDQEVKNVEVTLVDEFFVKVGHTVTIQINKAESTFTVEYIPENVDLPTGSYYIEIEALDEELAKREYVSIFLTELPLTWEGLIFVNGDNSVNGIDENLQNEFIWTLPFPFKKGAVNNRDHVLLTGNDAAAKVVALNVNSGEIEWSGEIHGSPASNYFNHMYYDQDDMVLKVTSKEDEVRQYMGSSGNEFSDIQIGNQYDVEQLFSQGGYTYVELKSLSQEARELRVYFSETGSLVDTEFFFGDIIKMESWGDFEILILANDNDGMAFLSVYSDITSSFSNFNIFEPGAKDMAVIGGGRVIVTLLDQLIMQDLVNNQIILLESGNTPDYLEYDDVNGYLWTARSGNIKQYVPYPWNFVGEVNGSTQIKGIFNLYNK
ncbi:MAG: hypothetical protein ACI8XB_001560 [Patiriisocius sp.]